MRCVCGEIDVYVVFVGEIDVCVVFVGGLMCALCLWEN